MTESQRKEPRQGRARATVAAILEATAQVLVAEGYARLNTTKVASRAGVSVGTLYQYFTDKDTLVRKLFERHTETVLLAMQDATRATAGHDLETRVRATLKGLLRAKAAEGTLGAVLMNTIFELDGGHAAMSQGLAFSRQLLASILEEHRHEVDIEDVSLAASTLVYAVDGVINAWRFEGALQLDDPQLFEELMRLTLGYLIRPRSKDVSR